MLAIAILFSVAGLLSGYILRDFTWFARCGALVVAVGITLLSRASVLREDIRPHIINNETGLSHLDPEHYKRIGESTPDWVLLDSRTRAAEGVWGPLLTFIGTLIWGFGDLLNKLLTSVS